jgi:hypothetical protein
MVGAAGGLADLRAFMHAGMPRSGLDWNSSVSLHNNPWLRAAITAATTCAEETFLFSHTENLMKTN